MSSAQHRWPPGGGETGSLIRTFDWAATALGPRETWPAALRAVLLAVLHSPLPQTVLWGERYVQLYNDAVARLAGDKHPAALGRPLQESWPEAWPVVAPILQAVRGGASRRLFNQRLRLERSPGERDAWFDLNFSPLFDDSGSVAGVLVQCEETTDRMYAAASVARSHVQPGAQTRADERLALAIRAAELAGAWEWDLSDDRVLLDERFVSLSGLEPSAASEGVPFERFCQSLHPEDRPRVRAALRQCIDTRESFAEQYRLQQPNGRVRWVFARGHCLYDTGGGPLRVIGSLVDITQQKMSQEALSKGELEIRRVTDALPVLIGFVDRHECNRFANKAYYEWFGLTLEQLVGCSLREVLGDAVYTRHQPYIRRALAGEQVQFEIELPHADGRARSMLTQYLPRCNPRGDCSGFYVLSQDMTERQHAERALRDSEREFRAAIALSPALHWTADAAGEVTSVADRWHELTGTEPRQAMGSGWRSFVHPEDCQAVENTWTRARSMASDYDMEFRVRVGTGGYHWMRVRARPLLDEQGRVQRWYGMAEDIQERRQAEQALRELNESLESRIRERTRALAEVYERLLAEMAKREHAQEALRQSQKMEAVGQLTGGIAHDFNNMLTGVIGSLDLLRRRLRSGLIEDAEHFVDIANHSARRAAALTHRLLAFSRRQPLNPQRLDLNQLIRSMEELLRRTLGEQIRIQTQLGDVPAVYTDENQLESALLNLVINARDAMPDGGALTIETARAHLPADCKDLPAGDYAVLQVSDTGYGMSAQTLEKVFEPFFTTKPIGQGTGLGLSMIYGFAKQSGGHVRLVSEPGCGTVASLYLPLYPETRGAAPEVREAPLDYGPALAPAGESVLVVEDDEAVRLLVLDVLAELGYQAHEAGDAQAALAVLESPVRIDLLISDVGLPDMNGRQLADFALRRRPGLPVLFMTGYAETAARAGFLAAGMELIAKPFSLEELAAKVRGMIRARPTSGDSAWTSSS
jgi:PAS domain S-box-containing protein